MPEEAIKLSLLPVLCRVLEVVVQVRYLENAMPC